MVAELTGITVRVVGEDKTSRNKSNPLNRNRNLKVSTFGSSTPQWIKTAIRERSYSVITSLDIRSSSLQCEQFEEISKLSSILEEPIYSVVNKNRKFQMSSFPGQSTGSNPTDQITDPELWVNSGNSGARGVIGTISSNYHTKISKEQSDVNECFVNEELDMLSTAVDSVNDEGTLGRNWNDFSSVGQDEKIIDPQVQQRARWRIMTEEHQCDFENAKMRSDKSKISGPDGEIYEGSPPKYCAKSEGDCYGSNANSEIHDKDSLNETGSITGGPVEGNRSRNVVNNRSKRAGGSAEPPLAIPGGKPISTTAPPRSLLSRILARTRSPDHDLLDQSEPFSQLWIVLSNVYGELIIVLMVALCLVEVIDTPIPLLSLQSIFLMYLYVGSIVVIMSIYLWVLVDSCGSLANCTDDAELGTASLTRFGSLKRAHISRSKTATTSFYIRVGALLFGLATLVFNGLEMAMHSMMQGVECLNDVVFVHPVLHGLFTFLQMHFLFVNSQVLVERFGLVARFGFIHLAATNIAVWARLVIWNSAQEWTYFVHLAQKGSENTSSPFNLRTFSGSLTRHVRDNFKRQISAENHFSPLRSYYQPISDEQISQVVTLQDCLNANTLGQLWISSMPFLYPFIVQFSLIAAAVTFVMGQNVGKSRYSHKPQKFHGIKDVASHTRIGCDSSSKGLFLGILSMTAGIVVILIFLVVREDDNFPPATLSWLTTGTLIGILALSGMMTASGLVQVRQMSIVSRTPPSHDNILSNLSLFGVQLYCVFTIVVCCCALVSRKMEDQIDGDTRSRYVMLLTASVLQLVQCFAQSTLIAEASRRSCITRYQMMTKPSRQVITFLLFSNAVLWAFDTVITQNWITQELQLRFFGVLAWGVVSRMCLPLLIFYRFHSCVLLLEAWSKCYRTPRGHLTIN
ncbi:proton channel OtopLc-like [Diachasmimorpha longicaudata]|uniref:proton channel OtopLc-like n=1 Tax=Diachasmimorpha longicaudata TaxID=58733 RepID=UPI0030B86D46